MTLDAKTGVPTPISGDPLPDGTTPRAIAVDPQKRYLYVASSSGEVRGYALVSSTGTLTAMTGSPFPTSGNPQALVLDPAGAHLYAADSQPSGVAGLTIDPATGALTAIPGSPFTAPNGALSVVMDGAGALLHVANGTNVDCYTVSASTGALTYIGPSVTNGRAVALAVDAPDGFLYALDNVSNQIEVFSIQATNYNLALIAGNPYPLFAGAGTQSLGASSITVVH